MKNLSSKKVPLQGPTNHSLYKFPQKSIQSSTTNSRVSCFFSNVTPLPTNNVLLWDNRLGHLTLPFVNKILSAWSFPQKSIQSSTTNSRLSCFSSNVTPFPTNNVLLWHNRLGHPILPSVNKILSVCSLPTICCCDFCVSCQLAKSHKLPFVQSASYAIKLLEKLS